MWIIQLCIIILTAGLCGAFAKRIGQSRVVGEIAAGLLLGPSILGAVGGDYYGAVFSSSVAPIMSKLGELGLVLLMFQLGLHLDLKVLREQDNMRVPVAVALMGIAVPFTIGCGIAWLSLPVLAIDVPALAYVLFCGVTLSISAVPVMARIVVDLGMTGTGTAAIALTAATLTDALGWLMLAMIAALTAGVLAWHDILCNVVLLCVFAAVSLLVLQPIWTSLFRRARGPAGIARLLPPVFCYVLISSWITAEIGENRGNGKKSTLSLYDCFSGLFRSNSRAMVDGWTLKSRAASAAVF
ncbi:cation:proton antiporter [Herbaspirillum sp. RTI4]|uniref:cation:proton antiporter n=1 Tax=Herbaspirillum sp. RTI4 TaxID=3048640 RepID=UPI002B239831|nr:cation:proton antiporter [Herbaspirillum sp. RTI4]MEA9983309.1 cation:proton antiporter [Herbaspirillum sp. RTI4]